MQNIRNSSQQLRYFRKWSNKGYGIFSSLKVVIKICVLSVGYLLLVKPVNTIAQVDTITFGSEYDLDEVVVTEKQRATSFSELTNVVLTITANQLKSFPVSSLNDILEHVASIDVRQRGAHGVQADLMIRGGTFDQILVLINGVNITDPQTGHHNLNIPIDLQSIQRIELLQGPGARVYGLGAFSGAINIITSPEGKNFVDAGFSMGEYGLIKINTSAALSAKKHQLFVSASSSKSEGFAPNTDFAIYNVFVHSSLKNDRFGELNTQVGLQNKGFGAQSFYTPRYPEQYEKTATYIASTTYTKKWGRFTFTPSVYFRLHNDRFELFRNVSPEWYTGHNYHSTTVSGARFGLHRISQYGKVQAGVELRNEKILSNVLGELLAAPVSVPGGIEVNYTRGKSRNLITTYADYTLYLGSLSLSAGILSAHSNTFGSSLNYGLDAGLKILRTNRIYASYNRTTRYPTFTDLYYSGPTNSGNPELTPETADNFEVGIKSGASNFDFSGALFMRNGKNIIDWVKDEADEKWTTMNYTTLNTKGLETQISYDFSKKSRFIQNTSLSYTYINSDKLNNQLLSYYVLDYLKHKLTFNVNHLVYKDISLTWSINWQDRAGTYTDFSTSQELAYKPFFIVNATLKWEKENLLVFADANNILNTQFFDLGNVPQPDRWLSFGIRLRIE